MNALLEINQYLEGWLLRYRLQRAVRLGIRGLLLGLVGAVLIAWWAVPRIVMLLTQFFQIAVGVSLTGLILAGLIGLFWPIKRDDAIRFFDRRFNLQERISTAVEFSDQLAGSPGLLAEQQQDALEHARRVNLKAYLPWRISWLEMGVILALILAIAGLTTRNQPYFLAAMQKQGLIKHIQEQAARLEEIRSNIQKLENLTPEQRDALESPIEEAARKLAAAESLEEALSALNQAEADLRSLAPIGLQNQAASLKQAGETILSHEGSPLRQFGENLSQGNIAQAAQELGSLDLAELDQDQKSQLANDLQNAAKELAASDPTMAEKLQNAAESLQAGETFKAGQALSEAAQSMAAQAGEISAANVANQAAAQLNASQQNLAQAGASTSASANSGSQASNLNGEQTNGLQGGANQNNSMEGSNAGSSAGAGQGESQGSETSGGEASSQPIDTSNQPGDGGERPYESIYAPEHLNNLTGQDVQLPGSGQPGQVIGQAGQEPGAASENLIPYMEVFPAYESIARQAIESGQIPQHLRALVRDYFSSLAP